MRIVATIAGLALIFIILGDAFETVILPRRVTRKFRLTRVFYRYTWLPWRALCRSIQDRRRREARLSFFGPLSLILLLILWALLLILGFAFLYWAAGSGLVDAAGRRVHFASDLYVSGTTFTTLGLGDLHPVTAVAKFLMVWEAATGFGFLAIVVGYLPVVYQAFSRREGAISLLDARAGSPPAAIELLRRYAEAEALPRLDLLLQQWELWSAELLESHISYPYLTLFRSQHSNESWVGALTMVLDLCALLLVGIDSLAAQQAQLTFAMARHAAVDLAQVLGTPPLPVTPDRLPDRDFSRLLETLARYGAPLRDGTDARQKLGELRDMYEPYLNALANYLVLDLPPWFAPAGVPDNWQTSAWGRVAPHILPPEVLTSDDHL